MDGALTVSADRAVPVAAAVAAALGLPGIGRDVAHLMTHKIAMRRRLADAGVPQPRFAAVRTLAEARAAVATVGLPAVLKPADSGGQRGVFLLEQPDDIDVHLHAALAESAGGEAIVERYHEGLELNGLVLARDGEVIPLTLSDRLRPPGIGFGVGWIHVYPATIFGDTLAEAEQVATSAVHALGLRNGIAFPQLLVCDDGAVGSSRSRHGSRAARWPTSRATRSASTWSRSRCARRSAWRFRTSSRYPASPSRWPSAS